MANKMIRSCSIINEEEMSNCFFSSTSQLKENFMSRNFGCYINAVHSNYGYTRCAITGFSVFSHTSGTALQGITMSLGNLTNLSSDGFIP